MLDQNDDTENDNAQPDTPAVDGDASAQDQPTSEPSTPAKRPRRRAATRPTGPPVESTGEPVAQQPADAGPSADAAAADKQPTRRRTRKKADPAPEPVEPSGAADVGEAVEADAQVPTATKAPKRPAKRSAKQTIPAASDAPASDAPASDVPVSDAPADDAPTDGDGAAQAAGGLFSAAPTATPTRRRRATKSAGAVQPGTTEDVSTAESSPQAPAGGPPAIPLFQPADPSTVNAVTDSAVDGQPEDEGDDSAQPGAPEPNAEETGADEAGGSGSGTRRRRRRGGRRRRKSGDDTNDGDTNDDADQSGSVSDDATTSDAKPDKPAKDKQDSKDDDAGEGSGSSTRRRRRRRRKGEPSDPVDDDPDNTVVKVRERRQAESEITSVGGSTRLEAKKQRRREGREASRRRPPILSESEFLARRESVARQMVVRQQADLTQIAVLEDNVLVEHYVAQESQASMIGNVYLGRVQNVLPSMEAAFTDIGKGRNGVLYAGEVDWSALGMDGKPRRIEEALSSGQHVLVQVSKDPVGHKGARLTAQISLPGRFLVYVPNGHTSGISRKLPEPERARLKALLKEIVPSDAGVIIRTAAEGATEEQLTRDVGSLTARWDDIETKAKAKGQGPKLLYGEPDLLIKVVRDLFTEDFTSLVVQGDDAWDNINAYVGHVAPDLAERCQRHEGDSDAFAAYRVDEQIAKALDRKVFLPSGGSLVIDRTEAMTVVDVNTGKFTGSGGNLEETVTKNNLEAAEEIVRQLRLRDIGGIIVVDFIDMVLESNRDLVLRRMVECLSRDRTRHQVAEVTSLGLVQMTRKKIGTGLVEAFSELCEHCGGRGLLLHSEPVAADSDGPSEDASGRRGGGRRRGGRSRSDSGASSDGPNVSPEISPETSTETSAATSTETSTETSPDVSPEASADADPPQVPALAGDSAAAETPVAAQPQSEPAAPRPSLEQPRGGDLPEAITPRKRTPRKRVTRRTAPPAAADVAPAGTDGAVDQASELQPEPAPTP